MAKLPTVAIIGRPNSGKSTLFNRLVGKRIAIESDIAGTTRDVVAGRIEGDEVDYLLVDTGGMGGGSTDKDLEKDVAAQSLLALSAADVILFAVDANEELTSSDEEVVRILRKKRRHHVPVIIVAAKCDNSKIAESVTPQLQALGIGDDIVPVSAIHNVGTGALMEKIDHHLKKLHFKKTMSDERLTASPPRIAIIGKPNVGKSSLVNTLMPEAQRKIAPRIVSPIPGTTRDTGDTLISRDGNEYIFVDTAGLRRRSRVEEQLESLANLRSIQAMENADITALMIEATEPPSRQEKRLANMAISEGKGLIILVNKADLLSASEKKAVHAALTRIFSFCRFAPILLMSSHTEENLPKLFPLLESIRRNRERRIPMRELRRWFDDASHSHSLPTIRKTKHLTQADEIPPTFVLFVKDPRHVQRSDLRYLENSLRQTFAFDGTPIRWITKKNA